MINVVVENKSGIEWSLQTFERQEIDSNSLEVVIFPTHELQGHAGDDFLLNDPAPGKFECNQCGRRLP